MRISRGRVISFRLKALTHHWSALSIPVIQSAVATSPPRSLLFSSGVAAEWRGSSSLLWERTLVASLLNEISLAFFHFVAKFGKGEAEPWASFCRASLGRNGNGTCTSWKCVEVLPYRLACVWPYCFAYSCPWDRARARPNLAFHCPHFFSCFEIILYITISIWKVYIFKLFNFFGFANKTYRNWLQLVYSNCFLCYSTLDNTSITER